MYFLDIGSPSSWEVSKVSDDQSHVRDSGNRSPERGSDLPRATSQQASHNLTQFGWDSKSKVLGSDVGASMRAGGS